MPAQRYAPIEDHGIIGDLHTVALVAKNGSIDYLCLPSFDSPSVFAALLDAERGGCFQIAPHLDDAVTRQLYLPDTNVLLTRFLSDSGVAEISDFMPVEDAGVAHNVVRRAKTIRGEVCFDMHCDPRFDYARAIHSVVPRGDREVLFIGSSASRELVLRLRSSVPMHVENGAALCRFTLGAEQSAWFVLEVVGAQDESPCGHPDYVSEAFKQTVNFWRRWISRSTYKNRWRETVNRSALALKLLTSREHGSIVAAPTFGLPEHIGGVRNWDYRYCWIRDSSFTLYGMMRLGFTTEAAAFMRWMMARSEELEPDGSLQIMYSLDGSRAPREEPLQHLEGYMGSRPVSIGNAANVHLQLDIYGELMDSLYLYDKYGSPIPHDGWVNVVRLVDWVCANWRQKDESIWEVRGGRREFLYSRVMCWVAIDRAIRLATRRSFPAPLPRWYEARDAIYMDVYERFWSAARGGFVQHPDAATFDAAALLMPLVRFISPTDPRWIATLRGIEQELVSDSLVYRYRSSEAFSDGLTGQEGTFSMCSFWYVECLSRMGDLRKARFFFEKMLGYANHVGLYGEELGPRAQHLGNFPQAFTHLALISAAYDLDRRLSTAGFDS
ncbi:glycoside hydrolase family 15 protein [Steroidobacter cummioxidans]|uniref:glycoside hydrolase family 15 protein n=1 Tax=Steroidobacter cummioxidans TaxID=1803913 RepID=UPI000E315394|nr:glycoside hydrolase family 15 protein [Steroidobacter cummioxidans]